MSEKNKKPFIHLFKAPTGHYIYDVNKNSIVKVTNDTYEYFESKDYKNISKNDEIRSLINKGYLKNTHIEESYNPITPYIHQYLDTKVCNLILQVTQNCNLRCEYCAYSGSYSHRIHSNNRMTFEVAKRAVDFLVEHSKDALQFYIGFYGGEPLLEYELIKKCVEYANKKCEGKKIKYHLTTNATKVNIEQLNFFIENDFDILISLDGPIHIHNKHRKFAGTDKGSYSKVLETIKTIKKISPSYYANNITYNAVLDAENSFEEVADYFVNNELFGKDTFQLSGISSRYSTGKQKVTEKYLSEHEYVLFKFYLYKMKKMKNTSGLIFNSQFSYLKKFFEKIESSVQIELPKKWHHGGPCVPGAVRTFITTDGKIFPCERVSEVSEVACIGDIYKGWNYENIIKMLNIENITPEKCQNCWAYQYCTTCIGEADNITHISKDNIINHCTEVLLSTEAQMKDYVVLKELGYSIEEDYFNLEIEESNCCCQK